MDIEVHNESESAVGSLEKDLRGEVFDWERR